MKALTFVYIGLGMDLEYVNKVIVCRLRPFEHVDREVSVVSGYTFLPSITRHTLGAWMGKSIIDIL